MDIPIYQAVGIKELYAGSTLPCLMEVMDMEGNYLEDSYYVVKVFQRIHIEQTAATNKEFYVNALARAFDLQIPECAIIKVDDDIIQDLKKIPKYANFDIGAGYYYGSKYIAGVISYQANHTEQFESWQFENVFAFDALIQNIDRRISNPNVIIDNDDLYVIDHHLSFNVEDDCRPYLALDRWAFLVEGGEGVFDRKHIFYEELRVTHKTNPITFDEFEENLRNLQPRNLLEPIGEQLEACEQNVEDVYTIINYLDCIKQNSTDFINLLKQLLV